MSHPAARMVISDRQKILKSGRQNAVGGGSARSIYRLDPAHGNHGPQTCWLTRVPASPIRPDASSTISRSGACVSRIESAASSLVQGRFLINEDLPQMARIGGQVWGRLITTSGRMERRSPRIPA